MLVHAQAELDLVAAVSAEGKAASAGLPADFYEGKLRRLWEKARRTTAYAHLGEFTPEAFAALPPTAKQHLKDRPWDFVRIPLDRAARYYETTGTTGRPTPTPRTAADIISNTVSVAESWRGVLGGQGGPVLSLLPSDVVPVADLIVGVCEYLDLPVIRAYPYTTGITSWDTVIHLLEVARPTVVFVAPGVLLQFTQILKGRGLLDGVRDVVRTIMLLGEVSTPALREMLGRQWDAQVLDASYGSTESGTLATCCAQDRLHALTAANLLEVSVDGAVLPLEPGRSGALVATPLNNDARPLLRLEMGDEVEVGSCSCGRAGHTLRVRGRSSDRLLVKGRRLNTFDVESVVYSVSGAMGYLVEVTEDAAGARLLLERDPAMPRDSEAARLSRTQDEATRVLDLRWDEVRFVNSLPAVTKAGGSQKNWKRTNLRVVSEL